MVTHSAEETCQQKKARGGGAGGVGVGGGWVEFKKGAQPI